MNSRMKNFESVNLMKGFISFYVQRGPKRKKSRTKRINRMKTAVYPSTMTSEKPGFNKSFLNQFQFKAILFYSFKFIQQKSFFTHSIKNFVLNLEI